MMGVDGCAQAWPPQALQADKGVDPAGPVWASRPRTSGARSGFTHPSPATVTLTPHVPSSYASPHPPLVPGGRGAERRSPPSRSREGSVLGSCSSTVRLWGLTGCVCPWSPHIQVRGPPPARDARTLVRMLSGAGSVLRWEHQLGQGRPPHPHSTRGLFTQAAVRWDRKTDPQRDHRGSAALPSWERCRSSRPKRAL